MVSKSDYTPEETEKEERDILIRRAYEKVSELLDGLKINMWEAA
jgi:hypothetical protein